MRNFLFSAFLCAAATAFAQTTPPGSPAPAKAPAPAAAFPSGRGPLALGQSALSVLAACQRSGWVFHARDGEDVKTRRGVRYTMTVANVIPADSDEAKRYRLTFLDGRLVGLRVELRHADPRRAEKARTDYGAPAWEIAETAEWISPDRRVAHAVWKDGSREELVYLGLLVARGFFTTDEVTAEVRRRHAAAKPPAPPPPTPTPQK
jgi:hypothetical protein